MLFHPHIHVLIPAVGARERTAARCANPRNEEYLIPERALAHAARNAFRVKLASDHPDLLARISSAIGNSPSVGRQAAGARRCATGLFCRIHCYSPNQRARRLEPKCSLSARRATDGS